MVEQHSVVTEDVLDLKEGLCIGVLAHVQFISSTSAVYSIGEYLP